MPKTIIERDLAPSGTPESASSPRRGGPRGNPLWWIVIAAFVLQIAVWTAWFIIAAKHRVAEVPLVTQGEK